MRKTENKNQNKIQHKRTINSCHELLDSCTKITVNNYLDLAYNGSSLGKALVITDYLYIVHIYYKNN